ncbi:hypothetical protein RR48_01887 [Papilio machaon]|uniref:TIL domain-containing protein n=1 Tax=Papilio machaon TaxID=76193 RepID=A0A0N1PHG7_PAPMA|nr:hypothetical protein RR48_01887 [Papilio machaon]
MNSYVLISVLIMVTVGVITSPVDENKPFDCPPNEEYYKCSDTVCQQTCANLFERRLCIPIDDCYKPACLCLPGYLRGYNGTCIPKEDCMKLMLPASH